MNTTLISNLSLGTLLLVLFAALIFILFFTKKWGVQWFTWLLALPTGSMRGGFALIIVLAILLLIGGYFLGYIAH